MAPVNVLHLLGSATSQYYFDLSIMYGRTCAECADLDHKSFNHRFAVVYGNGKWGFPNKLDDSSVKDEMQNSICFGAAMAKIEAMKPQVDVVVPHMFCLEGMTRYRTISEMLGIEVLGCGGEVCAVGQDKFLTKEVAKNAGIACPKGELLRMDRHGKDLKATAQQLMKTQIFPFIVKPAREDNSIGLSLVRNNKEEDVVAALSKGFQYDDMILAEEYIAGREVRVAVLEVGTGEKMKLVVLPKMEYILEDIRESKHKLRTDSNGKLLTGDNNVAGAIEKAKTEGDRICPAVFTPEEHARIDALALRAHSVFGCKYYSLYDVRIDKDGMPFMLESCLVCSFSPYSVVVTLAGKSDDTELKPHPKVFEALLRRAAGETCERRRLMAEGSTSGESSVKRQRVA